VAYERSNSPLIPIAKVWRKTSAKGADYFVGRLGAAKILILPNKDSQGDSDATHLVFVTEPNPPAIDQPRPLNAGHHTEPQQRHQAVLRLPPSGGPRGKVQIVDDAIPF
jgi:hypothetical protein